MSTTIDNKVVEMQFDNRQFERNVETSMSTIQKLKQSLNFTGAAQGLEGINTATKGINMAGLGSAVDMVQTKFSALGVMGVTALANITNSAVNTGKRIASALTIDPIKTGFSEYETKMNAIQTIMSNTASKGTTMSDVTRVINELNTYADKTIYNFAEMTKNIGTFTAAGVGLEDSAAAIQGIANLAASSGSTSQQASTAMYQLSQALAAGTVKLMDWNSVVNAGMGGEKFQEALKATAREMARTSDEYGYDVDALIEKNGSFRESLSEGWITADVLNKTLQKFTVEGAKEYGASMVAAGEWTQEEVDALVVMAQEMEDAATKVKTFTQLWDTLKESAQSGWAQTWELIIGDFEEAKETLTKISDVIGGMINDSAEARNKLISGGLRSGWDQLLGEGIHDEAGFKETLQGIVKEQGKVDLAEAIGDVEKFDEALKSGEITADMLSESISKFTTKVAGMSDEELKAAGYTKEQVKALQELNEKVQNGTLSMEEFAEKIARPSGRENIIEALWNAFDGIMSVITPVKEAFREIFPPTTAEQLYSFTESLLKFSEKLKLSENASKNLKRTFKGVFAVLDIVKEAFGAVLKAIAPVFGSLDDLGGGILGVTAGWGDWLVALRDSIKANDTFGKAAEKIAGVLTKIKSGIKVAVDAIKSFADSVREKFDFPGLELFEALLSRVRAGLSHLRDTADKVGSGIGSALKEVFTSVDVAGMFESFQKLWDGVAKIGSAIGKVLGTLTSGLIDGLGNANFDGFFDFINSLSFSAIGVFIAKFVKGFSDITDSISGFKESGLGILEEVKGCFEAYQTQLKAGTLMKIATAIAILVGSIVVLSFIDSEKLSGAIGAITMLFADLMGSMAIFTKISGDFGGVTKAIGAMMGISIAVLILASALKKVGNLENDELARGMIGVLGLTAIVVGAAKRLSGEGKSVIKGATQMVIFAAAIKILAGVCKDLSKLSLGELVKGLVGVGVLMAAVSIFLNKTEFKGKAITTAAGIVILSAAIKILASACKDFGAMSVGEIAKGLVSIGALLLGTSLFAKYTSSAKGLLTTGVALIAIAASMKIFASAIKDLSKLSLGELGIGLGGIAGALVAITVAARFMPKNMISIGVGLIGVSAALVIIAEAIKRISVLSWDQLTVGLVGIGVSLAGLAIALSYMTGALPGAAALLVASGALAILAPVLISLGKMDGTAIFKALVTVACAFAIIGGAAFILQPIIGTIVALAGSIALVGIAALSIGAGLLLAGVGLTALAFGFNAWAASVATGSTAIVAGLSVIILGIAELIPAVATKLAEGIIEFCGVIADGAPVIGEAVKSIVLTLVDVLVECVPALAEGLLAIIEGVLAALAKHTQPIIEYLFDFLIGLINGISEKLPDLIQAAVNLLMSFFAGVADALAGIDVGTMFKGLIGIGIMSGIMMALSAAAGLVPGAMVGVLGMGAVIAEIAIVLAAIGALAQLPGLNWLINEGGELLKNIGNAIGSFVGGLVGGIAEGFTDSLPQIGTNLSDFMENVKPFIEGAKLIDESAMNGVKSLVQVIMSLTAANLLERITASVTGESSISKFSAELPILGAGIAGFAQATSGINVEAVAAAAKAAKTLADMTSAIPNSGGVAAWFAGENSISKFAGELPKLGEGLKGFADKTSGVNTETITAAAGAAKTLAEMTSHIPNEGGVAAWFAGENSIAKFASELPKLGEGLKGFAEKTEGVSVESVTAAAGAAKTIAEMTTHIPNEGGVAAWFAGEKSVSTFAENLPKLGSGLAGFAEVTAGLDTTAVGAAATAAKSLAEMSGHIPNEGGMVAWFTGENSLAKFAGNLPLLGAGLMGFATATAGIDTAAVTAAATAAKSIAEMSATIPNEGGVVAWFKGDNSLSKFSGNLPGLGTGLKGFADEVAGIDPAAVTAAAGAAESIAKMTTYIPNEGGIQAWFKGDKSLATFAGKLPALGEGIKGFGDKVTGINVAAVNAASSAALSIAQMTLGIPEKSSSIVTFGTNLVSFGTSLQTYFAAISTITSEALVASKSAITTVKNAASIDSGKLSSAAKGISDLATSIKKLSSVPDKALSGFSKSMAEVGKAGAKNLVDPLKNISSEMTTAGKNAIDKFVSGANSKSSNVTSAGKTTAQKFADGIKANSSKAEDAAEKMAKNAGSAAGSKTIQNSWSSAGAYLVDGFAAGITAETFTAKAAATAMAKAALKAAEEALDENSPSKEGVRIGRFFTKGVAIGITDWAKQVYSSSADMASYAKTGLSNAITKVRDLVESGMDSQPTIRPVLDLSAVEAGAGTIGSLFDNSPVGVLANVRGISSLMSQNRQNGVNDDVVRELKKLRGEIGNVGGTQYNINGVTYDDGSNITDAVKTIVRAARIEGRV